MATQQDESDDFNEALYTILAGPWSVADRITVSVRQYADNPPKIRIERVKKNGEVRPFRGGFTATEATALAPVLLQAAEALAALKK